jgi:hypothetical protein
LPASERRRPNENSVAKDYLPPAAAVGGEDCPAFARAAVISVRKGNGTYPNAYRKYIARGVQPSKAVSVARGDANNAFWKSLIIQAAAIVDYSTDPILFIDLYDMADARSQDSLGNAFGRAMNTCKLNMVGEYPSMRIVSR